MQHSSYMGEALEEAKKAYKMKEVPIGAVDVYKRQNKEYVIFCILLKFLIFQPQEQKMLIFLALSQILIQGLESQGLVECIIAGRREPD